MEHEIKYPAPDIEYHLEPWERVFLFVAIAAGAGITGAGLFTIGEWIAEAL